jgi:phosphocarrier protein
MVTFTHTLKGEERLHARPAGNFVKKAQGFPEKITVAKNGKIADAKRLFAVISLQINKGDEITVTVDGGNESETARELQDYCSAAL